MYLYFVHKILLLEIDKTFVCTVTRASKISYTCEESGLLPKHNRKKTHLVCRIYALQKKNTSS